MAGTALACLRICRTGLYGILGISYDEQGLRFQPCVPDAFKGLEIENLNYQSAKLTVKTSGVGTVEYVTLEVKKLFYTIWSDWKSYSPYKAKRLT